MITKIICLANSKKFHERCVAGIEVDQTPEGFTVVYSDSRPKWIRPVSNNGHGEFPASIAQNINLLDVIEFDNVSPCPSSYQTENVYFSVNSVKNVTSIGNLNTNLDDILCNRNLLFGNRGKAVHEDRIDSIDYSLAFIKIITYKVFIKPENNQLRMEFDYNFCGYDLPITDINFEIEYRKNNSILEGVQYLYLTISLAVAHNDWHSKLIAGVIYI